MSQIRGADLKIFSSKDEKHSLYLYHQTTEKLDWSQTQTCSSAWKIWCHTVTIPTASEVDMAIIDGTTISNVVKPGTTETFNEYTCEIMNYIRRQFTGYFSPVHVFDVYIDPTVSKRPQ